MGTTLENQNPVFPAAGEIPSVPSPPYAVVRPPKAGNGFDVQAVADEFYREFPEQKGRTFIMGAIRHIGEGDYPSATTEKDLTRIINDNLANLVDAVTYMEPAPEQKKPYYDVKFMIAKLTEELDTVVDQVFRDKPSIVAMAKKAGQNRGMLFQEMCDHELGHALCNPGTSWHQLADKSQANLMESQADAYAMIRHFQRYGQDSTFPQMFSELRTVVAVNSDPEHWTSRAIERVIELNKKGVLKDLTPHQSRDLAIEVAEQTALTNEEVKAFGKTMTDYPFVEGAYNPATRLHYAVFDGLEKNCGKIARNIKSPVVHGLVSRYLDIVEKHDIFPKDEIQRAKKLLKDYPPLPKEKNLSWLARKFNDWSLGNLDKTPVPHAALSKPKGPVQK